jgi:hypothetical protein
MNSYPYIIYSIVGISSYMCPLVNHTNMISGIRQSSSIHSSRKSCDNN